MNGLRWAGLAAAVTTVLGGAALIASGALAAPGEGEVALAPVVAAWPATYSVTGAKSEPLYTEHISATRDGDRFALRIDVVSQGDAAMGVQQDVVEVSPSGRVVWLDGCTKTPAACADDPALQGFLASAALRALAVRGALPASGIARDFRGTAVVCVDDAALHPDASPAAVPLDPCFSRSTGAVLAHWSPASEAFVGATLAPGFHESARPDPDLLSGGAP